eukprot:scaffold42215_cov60-Phaeocystis_antarctica.AAC.1
MATAGSVEVGLATAAAAKVIAVLATATAVGAIHRRTAHNRRQWRPAPRRSCTMPGGRSRTDPKTRSHSRR